MNVLLRPSAILCTLLLVPYGNTFDQQPSAGAAQPQQTRPEEQPLNPRGRPDEKFVKVPQRYYVWHDAEGWHLRTAAQRDIRKFHGTIRLTGGTFHKLRTVGFERKGKYADSSRVNADRTKIDFTIFTSTSYDGYDFTIKGDADAKVEFELFRGGRKFPKEIFIGDEGQHPPGNKFSFPADPERTSIDEAS